MPAVIPQGETPIRGKHHPNKHGTSSSSCGGGARVQGGISAGDGGGKLTEGSVDYLITNHVSRVTNRVNMMVQRGGGSQGAVYQAPLYICVDFWFKPHSFE